MSYIIPLVKHCRRKKLKADEQSLEEAPEVATDATDGAINGVLVLSDDHLGRSSQDGHIYQNPDDITQQLQKTLEKHESDNGSDLDSGHGTNDSDLVTETNPPQLSPDVIYDTIDLRDKRKYSENNNQTVITAETHTDTLYARPIRSTLKKSVTSTTSTSKKVNFMEDIETIIPEQSPRVPIKSDRSYFNLYPD